MLIDGATFHDYRFDQSCFTSGADCHWECMYINAGVNNTIRNSRFRNCAIFDIFTTISGPDAAKIGHKNLKIYNNWFAAPWTETPPGEAPVARRRCRGVVPELVVRILGRVGRLQLVPEQHDPADRQQPDCVCNNIRVVGNLMSYDGGCQSRWSFEYNVWSTGWRTGSCSSTDKIHGPTFPYVNGIAGAGFDYHLTGRLDAGQPGACGCRVSRHGYRRSAASDER